jgi:hypothetical protein
MAQLTIKSKNFGFININPDTFNPTMASRDSSIYKLVEYVFNKWFTDNTQNGAPLAREIELCYFGSCEQPAMYSISGAIRQGIETIIEHMVESNITYITTKELNSVDIESAFQI